MTVGAAEVRSGVAEGAPDRAHLLRWAALVLVVFAIIFLRTPGAFLLPSLEADDGPFNFLYFYTHRDPASILRFRSGYVILLANLMGYVSVRLPTRAIPYGFAWFPLALALVTDTWLFGRWFRGWLGSDATRAVMCVLFALVPIAQYHVSANVDYSIWMALFLLVLMCLTPLSTTPWRKYAAWAATNFLVWSHPAAIVVAPFVVYRLVRERHARALHALTLASLAVHQVIGVEKLGIFAGLGWLESGLKVLKAFGWTFVIVAGTAFRSAFGAPFYAWAEEHAWSAVAAWSLALTAAAAVAARRSARLRIVFAVIAYVIFVETFLSVLGRGPSILLPLNGAPRYIFGPSMAFLALFVLLLDHYVCSGRPARTRAAVFGAVLLYGVALNAQLGHYFVATGAAARPPGEPPSPYVQSHPDNGRIIRDFFAELARLEAQNGSRQGIYLVAEKPNDWPIAIDTRGAAPGP